MHLWVNYESHNGFNGFWGSLSFENNLELFKLFDVESIHTLLLGLVSFGTEVIKALSAITNKFFSFF